MASAELIVHRYAQALYALSGEAGLHEQVEAQLNDLDAMLSDNDDLRRQLANPRVGRTSKRQVVVTLMGDAVCDVLRRTVLLMIDKGRAGELPLLRGSYESIAMAAEGRAIASVQSAVPLDDATRSQLIAQLTAATGKSITLEESVDDSLLGGLRVIIGSRMIDGSLKRRLEMLQQKMLSAPLAAGS
jgi:F-type H+-transporting ATPase subunit delta